MFMGCVSGAGSKPNINNGKYPWHKHNVDFQHKLQGNKGAL